MRLSIVVVALSTLAAAGPLPRSSNTTLEMSIASKAANITLGADPTASLATLKAAYEKLNGTEPTGTLSPDIVVALTNLKAAYEDVNEKRTVGGLIAKRGFWQWLKDAFEAPGLGGRSLDSPSLPDNETLDPATVAAVAHLKSVYDNLNEKREVGGLISKRGFWSWLKEKLEPPNIFSPELPS